jgi:hypothetical protein
LTLDGDTEPWIYGLRTAVLLPGANGKRHIRMADLKSLICARQNPFGDFGTQAALQSSGFCGVLFLENSRKDVRRCRADFRKKRARRTPPPP